MARRPVWDDVPRSSDGRFAPRSQSNNEATTLISLIIGAIAVVASLLFGKK